MTQIHDLHSHSIASDGTLTPTELVQRAAAAGVKQLALTDHDSTEGLAEAQTAAQAAGIRLINGVEVSVTWNKQVVHIVGLHVNTDPGPLQEGLVGLREFRHWRAEEIGRRLEKHGIEGAFEGAKEFAKGIIIGRTHFARFLVQAGHAKDVRQVFKKFLVKNKPGHVGGQWAELADAVSWIRAAGGMAVIAHPARYNMTRSKLDKLCEEFMAAGGVGIEVVSGSHSKDDYFQMTRVAERHGLYASCGSDYHGPENPWVELGNLPAFPDGCRPIWRHEDWPAQ